jgi:hypothetical protein
VKWLHILAKSRADAYGVGRPGWPASPPCSFEKIVFCTPTCAAWTFMSPTNSLSRLVDSACDFATFLLPWKYACATCSASATVDWAADIAVPGRKRRRAACGGSGARSGDRS